MKIKLLILAVILIIICTGCSQSVSESDKIITACFVNQNEDKCQYMFFTATSYEPESKDEIPGAVYTVIADNFSEATDIFSNSFGNIDLTHMDAFLTDMAYLSEKFCNDIFHIKKSVKISPLIKFYMCEIDGSEFFKKIIDDCSGSVKNMTELLFDRKYSRNLCTLSEIMYAYENTLYTASIPVIEIDDINRCLVNRAAVFHNFNTGNAVMLENDYKIYRDFIARNGKKSSSLKIIPYHNTLNVKIEDSYSDSSKISNLAAKYNRMGIDILNVVFFSKKCFVDYKTYHTFVNNLMQDSIIYLGD